MSSLFIDEAVLGGGDMYSSGVKALGGDSMSIGVGPE